MTSEEAIEILKAHHMWTGEPQEIIDVRKENKAFEMAIQALSQEPICDRDCEHCIWTECPIEPCDDAISRDFQIGDEVRIIGSDTIYDDCDVGWVIRNASEKVKTMYVMRNDGSADEEAKAEWYKTGRHNAVLAEVIKALPSVTQKLGKWIDYRDDGFVECPFCGHATNCEDDIDELHYCFYCGCRMVEPQESEDRNDSNKRNDNE